MFTPPCRYCQSSVSITARTHGANEQDLLIFHGQENAPFADANPPKALVRALEALHVSPSAGGERLNCLEDSSSSAGLKSGGCAEGLSRPFDPPAHDYFNRSVLAWSWDTTRPCSLSFSATSRSAKSSAVKGSSS